MLRIREAILSGQVWRLFSGHFTHWTWTHHLRLGLALERNRARHGGTHLVGRALGEVSTTSFVDVQQLDIRAPEHVILASTLDAMRQKDAETDAEHVRRMLDAWNADGLAAAGTDDTLKALEIGQADTVVIDDNAELPEEERAGRPWLLLWRSVSTLWGPSSPAGSPPGCWAGTRIAGPTSSRGRSGSCSTTGSRSTTRL